MKVKRKIIGILVCMMLMAMIPASTGLSCDTETTETTETKSISNNEPEPEGFFDRTIIRGVVLFPRSTMGGEFRFLALRIHYTTMYLGGVRSGTIMLRSISLSNIPNGFIGNCYIIGSFRGNLDAYT